MFIKIHEHCIQVHVTYNVCSIVASVEASLGSGMVVLGNFDSVTDAEASKQCLCNKGEESDFPIIVTVYFRPLVVSNYCESDIIEIYWHVSFLRKPWF